jgi:heme-degrading monooxygenase HmoA
MFARATTLQGSLENVGAEQYDEGLSRVRQIPGNQGTLLLLDRSGGKSVAITLWESEQAMAESREQANQLRQEAAEQAGGQIASVEEYEVAVWSVSS